MRGFQLMELPGLISCADGQFILSKVALLLPKSCHPLRSRVAHCEVDKSYRQAVSVDEKFQS